METDLTLPHVIRIGLSHGLVGSTALSIDDMWSALKFTHPKHGKIYNNSFGRLPGAAVLPLPGFERAVLRPGQTGGPNCDRLRWKTDQTKPTPLLIA